MSRLRYTFIWLVLGRPVRYGETMRLPASRKVQREELKKARRIYGLDLSDEERAAKLRRRHGQGVVMKLRRGSNNPYFKVEVLGRFILNIYHTAEARKEKADPWRFKYIKESKWYSRSNGVFIHFGRVGTYIALYRDGRHNEDLGR